MKARGGNAKFQRSIGIRASTDLIPPYSQGHHQIPTGHRRRTSRYLSLVSKGEGMGNSNGRNRQAHQEPQPPGSQLLAPQEGCYQHRAAPRCPQERRHPPHSPNSHQQPDHWCYQGFQVQDAICVRTFPDQRQRGQEQ